MKTTRSLFGFFFFLQAKGRHILSEKSILLIGHQRNLTRIKDCKSLDLTWWQNGFSKSVVAKNTKAIYQSVIVKESTE